MIYTLVINLLAVQGYSYFSKYSNNRNNIPISSIERLFDNNNNIFNSRILTKETVFREFDTKNRKFFCSDDTSFYLLHTKNLIENKFLDVELVGWFFELFQLYVIDELPEPNDFLRTHMAIIRPTKVVHQGFDFTATIHALCKDRLHKPLLKFAEALENYIYQSGMSKTPQTNSSGYLNNNELSLRYIYNQIIFDLCKTTIETINNYDINVEKTYSKDLVVNSVYTVYDKEHTKGRITIIQPLLYSDEKKAQLEKKVLDIFSDLSKYTDLKFLTNNAFKGWELFTKNKGYGDLTEFNIQHEKIAEKYSSASTSNVEDEIADIRKMPESFQQVMYEYFDVLHMMSDTAKIIDPKLVKKEVFFTPLKQKNSK